MRICIITASSGKNLELAQLVETDLRAKGAEVEMLNLVELNLPLFTPDSEKKFQPLDLIGPLKEKLKVDVFYILSPEYNGGIPPALTNFLAWVSRSTKDWRETFNGKPAVIGTFSAGIGSNVLTMLRLQFAYIGMNVVGRTIATGPSKPVDQKTLDAIFEQIRK